MVNELLRQRWRYERTERRGLTPNDPGYTSLDTLIQCAEIFDRTLTAHQRVVNRLGGHKKPGLFEASLDQAKSLRGIQQTLDGILDVMRFSVGALVVMVRLLYVSLVLTMHTRRGFRP